MVDKLSLLRHALSGLQRMTRAQTPDVARETSAVKSPQTPSRKAKGQTELSLEQQVRSRIGQIQSDDPHRRRRALRVVIEAALLREFGDRLELDPGFHTLVDQVVTLMDQDASLKDEIEQMLAKLMP